MIRLKIADNIYDEFVEDTENVAYDEANNRVVKVWKSVATHTVSCYIGYIRVILNEKNEPIAWAYPLLNCSNGSYSLLLLNRINEYKKISEAFKKYQNN